MGCVLMKQRRVFLDPTLLSSQTRCMYIYSAQIMVKILQGYCINLRFCVFMFSMNIVTAEEVKSLNGLFQQLGGTILDDGFMTRVILSS